MATATFTNNNLVVSDITDKEVKDTLVVNVKYGVNSTKKTDGFSCTFEKKFLNSFNGFSRKS